MRKLHKKYIVLNVFLIIYILSLSVGYAYFSESIKATGTAKTLSYYTQPLKLVGPDYTSENIGSDSYPLDLNRNLTYNHTTVSYPYYYIYYDVLTKNYVWENAELYIYVLNYANIEVTDFTVTLYDSQSLIDNSICPTCENYDDYGDYSGTSGYKDGNNTTYYGEAYISMWTMFKSSAFTTSGTTKQFYVKISYKSQGTTRYLYVYYIFNVK